jgi:acetoin utilization protein AcuB
MSRNLFCVGPTTTARQALEGAARAGVEHLLVLEGSEALVGVICRCDLDRARPETAVGTLARRPVVTVDGAATQQDAVDLMREKAVGCLPVLAGGLLLGVVTRSDMLRSGVPREDLGGPCAACGSQHALAPSNGATFCRECLECREDEAELGGGD